MDRLETLDQLKQALGEVPALRRLHYGNGEFEGWKNKVLTTLEQAYGKDSPQYRRFVNAPGKSFKVNTELGRQQDYEFQVDCYESALKTLVDRAQMG